MLNISCCVVELPLLLKTPSGSVPARLVGGWCWLIVVVAIAVAGLVVVGGGGGGAW